MLLCQIILLFYLAMILLENIYSTKIKQQQKIFNEIFGDNWEKAQRTGQNIQIAQEMLENQFKEIFDENWNGEEMGEEEEDNSSQKSDQMEENIGNDGQMDKESDQYQKEIIEKFDQMKKEYKERGEYSRKERHKIEAKIAKELGINRNKIYKWKKNLANKKIINNKEKIKSIQKYLKLKKEFMAKGKHSRKEWHRFETKLTQKIGFHYTTVQRWKKEIGDTKRRVKDTITKKNIISKYDEMKQKFNQKGKKTKEEWNKFEQKLKEKLGISSETIRRWKIKFENQN